MIFKPKLTPHAPQKYPLGFESTTSAHMAKAMIWDSMLGKGLPQADVRVCVGLLLGTTQGRGTPKIATKGQICQKVVQ